VQLARQRVQHLFLDRDELLRQVAAVFRNGVQVLEQAAVRINQVQGGQRNGHQHGRQEHIHVAFDAQVDGLNPGSRLLLGFVVLHQQTRHGRVESGLWASSDVRMRSRAAPPGLGPPPRTGAQPMSRTAPANRKDTAGGSGCARPAPVPLPGAAHPPGPPACGRTAVSTPPADTARRHPACRAWRGSTRSGCSGSAGVAANLCGCGPP